MKKWLSFLLACFLLLSVFASCGDTGTPSDGTADSSEGTASSYHEDLPETEPPVTEPDEDPFEGADPIPEDFSFPDNLTNPDWTVIGTIVLPPAATGDEKLVLAAEELRLHIEKVTGANLPVVGRTCDACGSLILATPETLPAITEWFADDLAWLADL
ncbi:MAG: hypothetical protein II719_01780, partial [Clostridia bacterium]|nr:hypothetical protein [Clostridia bacterium]